MSHTKILIVADVDGAKEAYAEAATRFHVSWEVAFSFKECLRRATEDSFSGIIIDILTLLRSSQDEKNIAYDLINLYPTLRLTWDKRNRQINLGLLEQSYFIDPEAELRLFMERCRSFSPRSMRKHDRVPVCLNALLSADESCPEGTSARTFTVNISEGGAFLHTVAPYERGEVVWLTLTDLADTAPIKGRVCWKIEWGLPHRAVPGIGVQFEIISQGQVQELQRIARSTQRKSSL